VRQIRRHVKDKSKTYAPYVYEVARTLRMFFKDFAHYNKKNPLNELVFIICSTRTAESSYLATYQRLRERFQTNELLARADASVIARQLERGGLAQQKARTIRRLMGSLSDRFGRPTLSPAHAMHDAELENLLLGLPGVGKKVARCVMMYSFRRKVFPVDTHCCRIVRRLGWVHPVSKSAICSDKEIDRIQARIPPNLRFSLHVNMVSLGRAICKSRKPRCNICPVLQYCRYGNRKRK